MRGYGAYWNCFFVEIMGKHEKQRETLSQTHIHTNTKEKKIVIIMRIVEALCKLYASQMYTIYVKCKQCSHNASFVGCSFQF